MTGKVVVDVFDRLLVRRLLLLRRASVDEKALRILVIFGFYYL
jgi:hypothetical protein